MSILDNEGHEPNGLGNRPRQLICEGCRLLAEIALDNERLQTKVEAGERAMRGMIEVGARADAEIERLRDDRWKHGAESMREAILQLLPGGQSCDPQQVADMIRAIALPAALEQGGQPK